MSVPTAHALFPGSFDPVTLGHLDLVRRARELFGRVTIGVGFNPDKRTLLTLDERVELLRRATAGERGIEVSVVRGLAVDAARALGASVIVRGARSGADFDYELAMARTNAELAPEIETVLLAPAPRFAHVSSTLVRQIAVCGGDASRFVPACVAEALKRHAARSP